jgi:hypothetical protein
MERRIAAQRPIAGRAPRNRMLGRKKRGFCVNHADPRFFFFRVITVARIIQRANRIE